MTWLTVYCPLALWFSTGFVLLGDHVQPTLYVEPLLSGDGRCRHVRGRQSAVPGGGRRIGTSLSTSTWDLQVGSVK